MTQEISSLKSLIKSATKAEIEQAINDLPDQIVDQLLYDWPLWARDNQITPNGAWFVWLILAGRGWGKTRVGAEQIRAWQQQGYRRFAFVGQTPAEVRDVMIEGESGILAISPKWNKPKYEPSKRRLTWQNGAQATVYSAENPEALRGPQHEKAWVDELAKFKYPQDTWDNLILGMRLGDSPQIVVTTTPKPIKVLKEIIKAETTTITKGSTYENRENLAQVFLDIILDKYEGTRLGRQELNAEMLDDNPGALWIRDWIEQTRINKMPDLIRIVVAIDPAVTNKETSDETGIVVAGIDRNLDGYVLEDISLRATPEKWARAAITAYNKWGADRIVGEANNGGDMIETILRSIDPTIAYKKVWASKGKATRAEPVSALYEQGKIHHIGYYADLEDELCEWEPGNPSPNRLDALVWAFTELKLKGGQSLRVMDKRALGL